MTNNDKGWLIFEAVTSIFAAGAGLKLLQTGSKVPGTIMKAITATDKALNEVELSIAAGTGLYALQNQQYGTSLVMLGIVAFGSKGLKGSGDFALCGVSKGPSNKTSRSSFADLMSPEDAARYNLYWDDVANGLGVNTRVKLYQWDYRPNADLYNRYSSVYDNPKYFNQSTGEIIWPGTNGDLNIDGFVNGQYVTKDLPPGEIIDRYGNNKGAFFAKDGISIEQRAMCPSSDFDAYNRYEIIDDITVREGEIAPWFDQSGAGI